VAESPKNEGAIFVEDLSEVPPLAVTVSSAHGVARSVEEEVADPGLPVFNPTCPWSPRSITRANATYPRVGR
jgi:4-hydroxy-3-methylbut-2-enyl diphosphate reductase